MRYNNQNKTRGFTLIEMVLVIVLLGIVGLSFGNIVSQAMNIYVDSTTREALSQQGRFITDRMHKELRNAVPGSVRISQANTCIEWLPIKNTAIYEELPVAPDSSSTIRILPEAYIDSTDRLVVFPVTTSELYNSVTATSSVAQPAADISFTPDEDAEMVDVTLTDTHSFPASSPARRLYIYAEPRAYCWRSNKIYLYKDYDLIVDAFEPDPELEPFSGTEVLMAENVTDASFEAEDASLIRNAQVKIELKFSANDETLRFDHNVLIHNTP